MKKLLLVLFIAATLPFTAQSWAAPGATWYYDYVYFSTTGYERIQNIGDTIINNRQYNKLQIFRRWYDQSTQTYTSYTQQQLEFTRADSGVVYFYRDSADYVLYDFNAQPGDTWVLRADEWISGSWCDTGSVVVDSIATTIINGDTLRVLRTSPVSWTGITFNYPRVIEKIGSLANLLPTAMCVTDVPQGYGLRCYTDSTGWTYQSPNWPYACDDMMGVEEPEQGPAFSVISDAQLHTLTLTGTSIRAGAVIQVYNSNGQLLLEEIVQSNNTAQVNFAGDKGGIYFVTVTSEQERVSMPFFVAGE